MNIARHPYEQFTPHTIWECYHAELPRPGTDKDDRTWSRPDFCGWSALGPISLFIENILGFHTVDGIEKRVEWRLRHPGRHGLRRLRFADVTTDLLHLGDGRVEVVSNAPYELVVGSHHFAILPGAQTLQVPAPA